MGKFPVQRESCLRVFLNDNRNRNLVLDLVGMEFIFFTIVPLVLCFISVGQSCVYSTPMFQLWLNSACTASRSALFLTLPLRIGHHGSEQEPSGDAAGTADLKWTNRYSLTHNTMHSSNICGGTCFSKVVVSGRQVLRSAGGIWWVIAFASLAVVLVLFFVIFIIIIICFHFLNFILSHRFFSNFALWILSPSC